ncbi:MAG: hypothetical protein CMJ46_11425 [Planctomyces sp.]|nr:hypothetical protein [Planctomyces sp.]
MIHEGEERKGKPEALAGAEIASRQQLGKTPWHRMQIKTSVLEEVYGWEPGCFRKGLQWNWFE